MAADDYDVMLVDLEVKLGREELGRGDAVLLGI